MCANVPRAEPNDDGTATTILSFEAIHTSTAACPMAVHDSSTNM